MTEFRIAMSVKKASLADIYPVPPSGPFTMPEAKPLPAGFKFSPEVESWLSRPQKPYQPPKFRGWQPHEIIWLEAAMSLPRPARGMAYKDVASMTNRTLHAIRHRVAALHKAARQPQEPVEVVMPPKATLEPSKLSPPSLSRLMGCR